MSERQILLSFYGNNCFFHYHFCCWGYFLFWFPIPPLSRRSVNMKMVSQRLFFREQKALLPILDFSFLILFGKILVDAIGKSLCLVLNNNLYSVQTFLIGVIFYNCCFLKLIKFS